jgi:hypothetical protein
MHRLLSIACALLAAAAVPASGAEDHDHTGKHGGIVVESGHHHLEVVARDGVIEVYVQGEDGKPEDVAAAKATAVVLSEGKKVNVALTPDNGAALKGTGKFKAVAGTTIVVTITIPDHAPEQARVKLD